MNHILRNLIFRHHVGGVDQKASHIVQPRPKSRFETGSGAGLPLTRHDEAIEPMATAGSQNPRSTEEPKRPGTLTLKDNTASRRDSDDMTGLMDALTLPLHRKSSVRETPIGTTPDNSFQQSEDPAELHGVAQSNGRNLSMTDEINSRIQTILHRLNSRQPERTCNQGSAGPGQDAELSNTINSTLEGSVKFPLIPEATLNSGQTGRVKHQSTENGLERRESFQSGLMQVPNWLTELQSDLHNRWQEINTRVEPDVINVTIGRVEVRAVQPEPEKQPETTSRQSGVMSLDDYLRKRNTERL